jgi:hypothetical protein
MARLKVGMVGGGLDALAGAWHRRAAALDAGIGLVAGAPASTRERALAASDAVCPFRTGGRGDLKCRNPRTRNH